MTSSNSHVIGPHSDKSVFDAAVHSILNPHQSETPFPTINFDDFESKINSATNGVLISKGGISRKTGKDDNNLSSLEMVLDNNSEIKRSKTSPLDHLNSIKTKPNIILPVMKKFITRLKNASGYRNLVSNQNQSKNIGLIHDKAYFPEISLKNTADTQEENNSLAIYFKNTSRKWIQDKINKFYLFNKGCNIIRTEAFIVNPFQKLKIFWDLMHLLLILSWLFYIPMTIAFFELSKVDSPNFYTVVFLIFDIFLNFNTAYFKNGVIETKHRKIIIHYYKSQLKWDIITISPLILEYFMDIFITEPKTIQEFRQYQILGLIKFLFYLKIPTCQAILKRIMEKYVLKEETQSLVSLMKILFVSFLFAHIFACFWYLNSDISSSFYYETWLSQSKLLNSEWSIQYLHSLYWASITMMTVGYGDVVPMNSSEYIFCTMTVIFGCAVYAYNISSIGMILQDLNRENVEFEHKVNIINHFMRRKNINNELQMRIREYLRFIWKEEKTQNFDEEHKIINLLSFSLKEELLLESYGSLLKNITMFYHNFSENCLKKTVSIIKEIRLIPEEKMFTRGVEDDSAIYILKKGKIELSLNNSDNIFKEYNKSGDYFGEIGFFTGNPQILSAKSKDFTTLISINRADFLNIIQREGVDFEKFCMIKDKILLTGDYSDLDLRCLCCCQKGHISRNCPLIHFIADREKIVKSHLFYLDQERQPNFYRKIRSQNALKTRTENQFASIKVGENKLSIRRSLKPIFGSNESMDENGSDSDFNSKIDDSPNSPELEDKSLVKIPEKQEEKSKGTKEKLTEKQEEKSKGTKEKLSEDNNIRKNFTEEGESSSLPIIKQIWKKETYKTLENNSLIESKTKLQTKSPTRETSHINKTLASNMDIEKKGNSTYENPSSLKTTSQSANFSEEKTIENFESVRIYKKYFPSQNCTNVISKTNKRNQIFWKFRNNKKNTDLEVKLAKYTFYVWQMKKRQPSEIIRKKRGSSARRKKKSILGGVAEFVKRNEKKWISNKINVVFKKFSDVVHAVTRSVGLKQNKKK